MYLHSHTKLALVLGFLALGLQGHWVEKNEVEHGVFKTFVEKKELILFQKFQNPELVFFHSMCFP